MIIWLASYPRSGNTLIRTILKQTMGLNSYGDDLGVKEVGLTDATKEGFGDLPLGMPWDDFYKKASESSDLYLVKTHLPPRDNQPVIYVVRDGRQSTLSYWNYHKRFHEDHRTSLMDLIIGCDYYGGWSEHYCNWFSTTDRKVLLLHFEDLLHAPSVLIQTIAAFIGHQGSVRDWSNHFDQLHGEHPGFFRVGSSAWQAPVEWTEFIDSSFFFLHGELMRQLDYVDAEYVQRAVNRLPAEFQAFIGRTEQIVQQKKTLEAVCVERQNVIDGLVSVCNERLELIQNRVKSDE